MEYYYTRYDGNDEEGLGSILQSQLHLYAYCRVNNKKMFFPGLQNISHYQYVGEEKEIFNKKLNDFFNIPSEGEVGTNYIEPSYLLKNWGESENSIKQKYIPELFEKIKYTGINYFDKNKKTLSVHIRNINPQDVCFDYNREYYSENKKNYFINLITNIHRIHGKNLDVHIFSQGKDEDFEIFEKKFNAKTHLNGDIVTTLYHLITSEILVTSNSSFSWVSHLYGQNKYVYSRNNFFHSWYSSTFLVDNYGNII
jgi:hypothetical protein